MTTWLLLLLQLPDYSETTLTPLRSPEKNFPHISRMKIVEVNNSFPTNYPWNQVVRYESNRFVVILDRKLLLSLRFLKTWLIIAFMCTTWGVWNFCLARQYNTYLSHLQDAFHFNSLWGLKIIISPTVVNSSAALIQFNTGIFCSG